VLGEDDQAADAGQDAAFVIRVQARSNRSSTTGAGSVDRADRFQEHLVSTTFCYSMLERYDHGRICAIFN
jgi:hypothetical protein